jgi:hypothetical protein
MGVAREEKLLKGRPNRLVNQGAMAPDGSPLAAMKENTPWHYQQQVQNSSTPDSVT